MNKIAYFVALIFVGGAVACTDELVHKENNKYNEEVTITAYTPSENIPGTRVAISGTDEDGGYNLSWINGDKISVFGNGESRLFTKAATGANDFTGILPDGEGQLYAFYPSVPTSVAAPSAVPFDISNGIDGGNFPMYSVSDDGTTFLFNHAMAYLQLSFAGGPESGDLIVSLPYGIYTSGTMNLTQNGLINYNADSKRTVSLSQVPLTDGNVFIAIPPMTANKKTIGIMVQNGDDTYLGTLSGSPDKAIEAGKYYDATVELKKVVPESVDLGLSVEWATFNVGAGSPEEYGDYFAWGETEPKATYSWENYKYSDGSGASFTKYNGSDQLLLLESEDDVATAHWGEGWRMPTKEEWQELLDYCTWENCVVNEVNCFKVISDKDGCEGNYIIIPKAGYRYNYRSGNIGLTSYYWSATKDSYGGDNDKDGVAFEYGGTTYKTYSTRRNNARPIRPVRVRQN